MLGVLGGSQNLYCLFFNLLTIPKILKAIKIPVGKMNEFGITLKIIPKSIHIQVAETPTQIGQIFIEKFLRAKYTKPVNK